MTQLATAIKALAAVAVVSTGAIAGGFYTGAIQFQEPKAGLQDIGDWGGVTEKRTEIITTLWVQNPNQFGIALGGNVQVSFQLYLNEVNLAEGEKSGISIQPGDNTVELSTEVRNQKIPQWWVAFIQNNETIPVRAVPTATVRAGPITASPELPTHNETLLTNSTPVSSGLSQAASRLEGRYTTNISTDDRSDRFNFDSENTTIGYVVREGWATWGSVTEESTVVNFHFLLHNPSESVPMPEEPEHLGAIVEMNGIEMFRAQGDDFTFESISNATNETYAKEEGRLQPGETKEVVYAVEMDNDKIDEWFTSHVRKGEQTNIRVELQVIFKAQGITFRLPEDSPAAYTCSLQTGILVDGQETETTCISPEGLPGVDTGGSEANGGDDGRNEPKATETPTATETPAKPPTAHIQANQTHGEAPLIVEFDGSQSTDPNNDIKRYVWRFKDGSSPDEGKTVTHTFRTQGDYEVELTVIDREGNRDIATVTIEVESRGM